MSQQLLRRAWDALDAFKQAYPENWHEDDEQVMKDLMRADMKMSGVQPKYPEKSEGVYDHCQICGTLIKKEKNGG